MEIKIKKNKKEKRVRFGTKKMRYFKIPLCRNFAWKIGDYFGPNDACQWCLRSKIGVWHIWFIIVVLNRLVILKFHYQQKQIIDREKWLVIPRGRLYTYHRLVFYLREQCSLEKMDLNLL